MLLLIVWMIIMLLVIGLLVWAVDSLAGLGLPPQVLVVLKVVIILVGILVILQRAGMLGGLGGF